MISSWAERAMMMKMIYVLVMLCATFALVACGGDEEPAPAPTSAPTAVPTATSVPPTPTAAPSLPAVVPVEVPEPGSETEIVLAVYTKWIEAVRAEDWQSVTDLCPPENRAVATAEKIGFAFNQFQPTYTRVTFPFPGYNVRNVTVSLYGEDTARTGGDIYNYNEFAMGNISDLWSKKDGAWYSENYVCTSIQ